MAMTDLARHGESRLASPAGATPIAAIVRAVDEPMRATRCSQHDGGKGCMSRGERCLTHDLWESLGLQIESYLASVTLADVLNGRLKPGLGKQAAA